MSATRPEWLDDEEMRAWRGLVEAYAELQAAADRAGEKIWRLPIGDDQRELMKSDFADIVNSGPREAHPLQGGAFLSYFVPQDNSVPWMHLDIAGVADTEKELPYYAKGATGWGVRTLVEWVGARAAGTTGEATVPRFSLPMLQVCGMLKTPGMGRDSAMTKRMRWRPSELLRIGWFLVRYIERGGGWCRRDGKADWTPDPVPR